MEKLILGSQNTVSKYNRPTQVLVVLISGVSSNVARGGGGGAIASPPPIGKSTKMQNEKNTVLRL